MFLVFNKEKMKSYFVSVGTVVVLLVASLVLQNNVTNKSVQTSGSLSKMPICKVETTEKKVAISINCIENMDNITNILDTLSKMKATATFFVTGEIVTKYPDEIKKIVGNGNEIGNLSNEYTSLKKMSKSDIEKQILECNEKIESLTTQVPTLFRVPYGEYNNTIIEAVESNNMEIIQWNIDSLDYNGLTDEELWERIGENLSSGSIILMHNEYLGDNLETIIHNIQEKGYEVTNVSDIMYKQNYQVNEKRCTSTSRILNIKEINDMPLIEILTDSESEGQLNKVIDKHMVNENEVIYIKEKNIENIKNIKLETIVINTKIQNIDIMKKIIDNSKYLIINMDYNDNLEEFNKDCNKIITYGYNSRSDITISSVKEEQSFLCLQRNIESIFGKKIEIQEIKANVNYDIDVYNVMIIIALTILYAK